MLLVRQSKHLHSLHAVPPTSLECRSRLLILARNYATKSPQDDNTSTPSPTSSADSPRTDSKSSKLNRSHQSSRRSNSEQNDASSTFFLPETWYRQAKARKTNKKWNSFLASTSSEGSGTSSPKAPKNRGSAKISNLSKPQSVESSYTEKDAPDEPLHWMEHWDKIKSPKMIRDHLDEYVIGQDEAKKVLSVAIFNHYSRVRHNLLLGGVPPKKNLPEDSEWKPNSRSTSILSSAANQGSPVCEKSNVLIAGPSGSGKTLLVKSIANVLQVPFSMNDATPMTQAGYVGEDVEGVIQRLLQAANYDVDLAQTGIVFIDEIDKIGRRSESANSPPTRDISGEGVQQALLRMLEGTTVTITDKNGRRRQSGDGGVVTKGDVFEVDTSQILFILSGAFVGLEEIIQERMGKKKSIGFHSSHSESTTSSSFAPFLSSSSNTTKPSGQTNPRPLSHLQPTDLITYGFIPEFVGRIPIITSVNPLTVSSLVQILTEPKNSIVSQFQELFKGYNSTVKQRLDKYYTECLEKLDRIDEIVAASNSSTPVPNLPNPSTHIQNADGITLLFTNASLTAISNYSLKNNTGARGLRSIIEKVLLESMFTAPGDEKMMGGWVIVTRESVLNAIENEVSEENGKVDDQQMKGSVVMVTKEEGYDAVRKILEKDDGVKNERDNKSEDIVEKPEKTRKKARVDDQNEGEERKAVRL